MGADHYDRRLCVANAITDSYCDSHSSRDRNSDGYLYADRDCNGYFDTHGNSNSDVNA
jgi:hypothetical protein